MKTIENKPVDRELIDHIKESLVDYEVPYNEGAWEKFNQPKKSKKLVFWLPLLSGAAAVLVLGIATFLIIQQNSVKQEEGKIGIAKTADKPKPEISERKTTIDIEKVATNSAQKYAVAKMSKNKNVSSKEMDSKTDPTQKQVISTVQDIVAEPSKDKTAIGFSDASLTTDEKPALANTALKESNIIDFLEKETKLNQLKEADLVSKNNKDKFTLGLVVAPSFGNVKRLNMGYGLNLDYQLSSKFSLNTGLAYNTMGATADSPIDYRQSAPTLSALVQTASTKNLESVEERIAGIEVPLEIKYHVNSNVYVNMGVSIFGVVNQQRSNTFIEEKIMPQSYAVNGRNTFEVTTMTARVTEQDVIKPGEDYTYLGFYNFAFGFKKKISKKNAFAIEPFVKLPMQKAQTENLKLIGTGVKLKFDF